MMKNIIVLTFCFAFAISCAKAPQASNVSNQTANGSSARNNDMPVSLSHGPKAESLPAAPAPGGDAKSKWSRGGTPIDTKSLDTEISNAQQKLKTNPNDANIKKLLSAAFYNRGMALTNAKQYASALGDFRRAVKYDPENADAKNWIEQIIGIYESINREYPKEGEEPAPLEFKSGI